MDGEAGTGKTVLNGSIFYELYYKLEEKGQKDFKCNIVVNHDEQVKVYSDIARKLGITEKYGEVVSKASPFLNKLLVGLMLLPRIRLLRKFRIMITK